MTTSSTLPKVMLVDSSDLVIGTGLDVSKDSIDMPRFQVLAKPHPLKSQTVVAYVPVGATIKDVIGPKADDTLSVSIEGEYIPREMWNKIRPKCGTQISVVRYPEGKTAKKIIGVVLLIVIAYFAPYLLNYMYTAYGMWGAVAAIGITLLATAAAYALIPPPELPKMSSDAMEFNRLNAITGTSNQATPYGTIPMVIGECRYYPTLAANPYTEILGDQQYLRMLFDLGYGDLQISDIKIGETPITSFDDVDYEISYTPDLFSDDVFELALADTFNPGANVTKVTQTNTDEISVDIVWGGGLFGANDKGNSTKAETTFTIEYRAAGTANPWINVANNPPTALSISTAACFSMGTYFYISSSARKTLRLGIRWKVPKGQYEVRMIRGSTVYGPGTQTNAKFDSAQVAVLRSIKHTNPSTTGTLKLALRIKATDQLNGVINQLSVLGQQKVAVYDSNTSTWLAPQTSFNPAWVYYWLLTACPGVAQLVDPSRIDLQAFEDWAADCEAKGFTCKGMIDRAIASGELFRMVLSSGRASFAMRDGKYSVLYDRDNLVPVQHFSPANSREFSGQRMFVDMPHALRVKFQNPALNWQEDEIIVLDDEHSFDGKDARGNASALPVATKFETLTVPFVTDPISAWRIARYQLAQGKFRPNTYSWIADIEHLVCTRGDLVYVVHDVTDWGSGFGLISSVERNVSNQVTKIYSAEPLMVEAGETYSIRVRSRTGASYISTITGLVAGTEATAFTLATPMGPEVDMADLYIIGKTSSGIKQLLVTRIEPSQDFNATIQAVEYNAAVQTYDDNPPATFISAISGTLILEPPPPPELYAVISNQYIAPPNDGGTYDPTVQFGIGSKSGYRNTGGGWASRMVGEAIYRMAN